MSTSNESLQLLSEITEAYAEAFLVMFISDIELETDVFLRSVDFLVEQGMVLQNETRRLSDKLR